MRLFKKNPNLESYWKKKFDDLQNDFISYKGKRFGEIQKAVDEEKEKFKAEIRTLEKEAVYWKEKALNFRKFHQ